MTVSAGTDLTLNGAISSADATVALNFGQGNAGNVINFNNSTITAATVTATGGDGNDTFNVSTLTSAVTLDGGAGTGDVIAATNDADFTLTNTSLARTGGAGTLVLSNIEVANLTGTTAAHMYTVTNWTGTGSLTDNFGSGTVVKSNDVDFTLTNGNLTAGTMNMNLTGIVTANLTGGGGDNIFTVSGWTGTGTMTGGAGTDVIAATNDVAAITLTDISLVRSGLGTLTLASIETANLNGGAGFNAFTVSSWTGTANLAGLGGSDSYAITLTGAGSGTVNVAEIVDGNLNTITVNGTGGANAFTLTNSAVTLGNEAINYTDAQITTLTVNGLAGDDSFLVSTLTRAATLDGGTESNTITATNDVDFTLANGSLVRTGLSTLTLSNIQVANLTGGAANNTFTVSNWTGTGTLNGAAGTGDIIAATNDVAAFTLTNTTLDRTGTGQLTLSNIEVANLTGGAANNTFTVTDWTGTGTLDGAGHTTGDIIVASNNVDFTLANASLMRSGLGTLALANIEVANLTGGASANTFTVDGWTGAGTLDGAGNTADVITATNDVAAITLTNTTLDRTGTGQLILASIETANLTGGAGVNAFTVSNWTGTANLAGLGGSDSYAVTFTGAGSGTVNVAEILDATVNTLTVNGTGGADAFTLTDTAVTLGSEAVNYISTEIATLAVNGLAGNDSFLVSTLTRQAALNGGGDTDTLTGGAAQTYTLDNVTANAGSKGTVTWTSIENLTDTGAGIFNMGTGGSVTGNLTATGGTVNYASYATPVTFNLGGGASTGMVGSSGITTVTGSGNNGVGALGDTITGSGATYNLTGPNIGDSGGISWTSFENLTDTGTGTFNVATGGGIAGNLNGGTNGTLSYAAHAGPVFLDVTANQASGIGGTISGIKNVTGSLSTGDFVFGTNATYNLTAPNEGNNGTYFWTLFENIRDFGNATIVGSPIGTTTGSVTGLILVNGNATLSGAITSGGLQYYNFINLFGTPSFSTTLNGATTLMSTGSVIGLFGPVNGTSSLAIAAPTGDVFLYFGGVTLSGNPATNNFTVAGTLPAIDTNPDPLVVDPQPFPDFTAIPPIGGTLYMYQSGISTGTGTGTVTLSMQNIETFGTTPTIITGDLRLNNLGAPVTGVFVDVNNLFASGAPGSWILSGSVASGNAQAGPGIALTVGGVGLAVTELQGQVNTAAATAAAAASNQAGNQVIETFGTDSVAEQILFGFAGDVGALPPMDHRLQGVGIRVPSCFNESREGEAC